MSWIYSGGSVLCLINLVAATYVTGITSSAGVTVGLPRDSGARYYCPLNTLLACQQLAPSSVVPSLTANSMQPCSPYSGGSAPSTAAVHPGDTVTINMGGALPGQCPTSCSTVSIAPFAQNPNTSTFKCISSCTPIGTGSQGTLTIPADTAPGTYTLLWLYSANNLWYSSCVDLNVVANVVPRLQLSATSSASDMTIYLQAGCTGAGIATAFCQTNFGVNSYCKTWLTDACGRSACLGGDFTSGCTGGTTGTSTTGTSTTGASTTGTSTTTTTPCQTTTTTKTIATSLPLIETTTAPNSNLSIYLSKGCLNMASPFCASNFGSTSYCKTWSLDNCGRAACQGLDSLVRLNNISC